MLIFFFSKADMFKTQNFFCVPHNTLLYSGADIVTLQIKKQK